MNKAMDLCIALRKKDPHFLKHIYPLEMKKKNNNNTSVGKLQQILKYLN